MYSNFQGEGCNFFFEEDEFFVRVATKDLLLYNPLLNLDKIPPRPRAIHTLNPFDLATIWTPVEQVR
jgi:hypothetical protein